ncbi:Mitochondrial ubiquitin ligase activator of NFKB 1 [Carex littledalei]|uniref:RING-type E3 ubiquitin transferase n=1 Tax=Carex littledalei TaxID=544730 RepID=A0A833QR45_9POAL|nr:Mitochondrial ubiquitin ligase activator of NFKB 1 [Carex littledalei]
MSSRDETAAALARAATAFDGALLGMGLALCATSSWFKYLSTSNALRRIRLAPSAPISDLRSVIDAGDGSSTGETGGERLVVIRGQVQPCSAADSITGLFSGGKAVGALVSQGSGERAVIIKQTQTCLYNEWRGVLGWSFDLHALFAKAWKEQRTTSFRSVPFVLVEGSHRFNSGYVNVKLDGSTHPLPLTTVYHHLHPVQATPYTLFQAILGNGYPVALLDEEKILPVGKEITAVGICSTKNESLEIKPCEDMPCFLSEKTRDKIESDLAVTATTLFWSGIFMGTVSVGILGYAIYRNWWRLKDWRERRKRERELRNEVLESPTRSASDDDSGEVSDGELCVICLMRRRRSAFVPCGHLVCCPPCALAVERNACPNCPVCRQSIRSSIRIYGS